MSEPTIPDNYVLADGLLTSPPATHGMIADGRIIPITDDTIRGRGVAGGVFCISSQEFAAFGIIPLSRKLPVNVIGEVDASGYISIGSEHAGKKFSCSEIPL